MNNLTTRQQQIFDLIRDCLDDTGFPPTRAEIASKLGLSGIPEIAERILIERDLTLLEKVRCRYHIPK